MRRRGAFRRGQPAPGSPGSGRKPNLGTPSFPPLHAPTPTCVTVQPTSAGPCLTTFVSLKLRHVSLKLLYWSLDYGNMFAVHWDSVSADHCHNLLNPNPSALPRHATATKLSGDDHAAAEGAWGDVYLRGPVRRNHSTSPNWVLLYEQRRRCWRRWKLWSAVGCWRLLKSVGALFLRHPVADTHRRGIVREMNIISERDPSLVAPLSEERPHSVRYRNSIWDLNRPAMLVG